MKDRTEGLRVKPPSVPLRPSHIPHVLNLELHTEKAGHLSNSMATVILLHIEVTN